MNGETVFECAVGTEASERGAWPGLLHFTVSVRNRNVPDLLALKRLALPGGPGKSIGFGFYMKPTVGSDPRNQVSRFICVFSCSGGGDWHRATLQQRTLPLFLVSISISHLCSRPDWSTELPMDLPHCLALIQLLLGVKDAPGNSWGIRSGENIEISVYLLRL